MVQIGLAAALWFILLIGELVYLGRLKEFRIDIAPSQPWTAGTSDTGRWDSLRRANYSAEGVRRLRIVHASIVLRVVIVLAVAMLWI